MESTTWASPWARWTCPRPTAPRTTVTSSDETAAHSPAPESMPPPRRMAGQRQTCDLRPPASNKHLMTSPTHQCPIREPNYLQMFHWKEANCFLAVSLPLAIFESGYLADGKFLPFLGVSNNGKEGWGGDLPVKGWKCLYQRERAVSVAFRLHPHAKWAGFRNSLLSLIHPVSSVRVTSPYRIHAHFFPLLIASFFMIHLVMK